MGVARVGPGDRPPRPAHDGRPDVEAAAGHLHDAVRAVRPRRAGHVARRRPRRRGDGRRDGVQARVARRRRARKRYVRDGRGRRGAAPAPARTGTARRRAGDDQPQLLRQLHHRQRARLLRGPDDRARPDRDRPAPRRPSPLGVRRRVRGGARPAGDLAVLGSVRAVVVLEGPGRPQARDRAVRADPGAVVRAGVLGVGSFLPRRQPGSARPLQQPGAEAVPVLQLGRRPRVAEGAAADQGRRGGRGRYGAAPAAAPVARRAAQAGERPGPGARAARVLSDCSASAGGC